MRVIVRLPAAITQSTDAALPVANKPFIAGLSTYTVMTAQLTHVVMVLAIPFGTAVQYIDYELDTFLHNTGLNPGHNGSPFGEHYTAKTVTHVLGTFCNLFYRFVPK